MGRDGRSDRSRGGPLRSLGDRETEPFGETGVAPVIHVQPIRRYERFERQMFSLVPMPHQIEATKMINALLLRGGGNQRHHVVYMSLAMTLGTYCGSINTTSAPVALRRASPSRNRDACGCTALPSSTELVPKLPEHEIRLFPDHCGVETREHVTKVLAAHATVQNGELLPWETADQFFDKAARIGGGRRAGAYAIGRR